VDDEVRWQEKCIIGTLSVIADVVSRFGETVWLTNFGLTWTMLSDNELMQ